jgi:hypothetical protein
MSRDMKLFAAFWAYVLIGIVATDYLPQTGKIILWTPLAFIMILCGGYFLYLMGMVFYLLIRAIAWELPLELFRAWREKRPVSVPEELWIFFTFAAIVTMMRGPGWPSGFQLSVAFLFLVAAFFTHAWGNPK